MAQSKIENQKSKMHASPGRYNLAHKALRSDNPGAHLGPISKNEFEHLSYQTPAGARIGPIKPAPPDAAPKGIIRGVRAT